jgi:hypothetical protein
MWIYLANIKINKSKRSHYKIKPMKTISLVILALSSIIYLLNPKAGIFEALPDNIPVVGNINEGLASFILYSSIEYFRGRQIGFFGQRNKRGVI